MRICLFAVLAALASGCATTNGPPLIMSAQGPTEISGKRPAASLAVKFEQAANLAADVKVEETKGASTDRKATASTSTSHTQEARSAHMFESGRTLIYANCSDFFAKSGRTQTQLMVWKDAIGLLGTLAAGVIALDGSGSTGNLDRLAVITLGSSAALSGIDIYTQRFLFSAENIDSVRELTLNALSAHAAKVQEDAPKSYEAASRHLLDNQALCLPPRIALLAREAIKKGEVVAYTNSAGPAPALAVASDRLILLDIGDRLGLPGPLSQSQAAAYYWLVVLGAYEADHVDKIHALLAGIPATKNPFDAEKKLRDQVPEKVAIREGFARLSPAGIKALDDLVNAKKTEGEKSQHGPDPTPVEIEASRVRIEVL